MGQYIILTILGCLAGHGIAWAFPPVQWLKQSAGISRRHYSSLAEMRDDGTTLTRGQNITLHMAKAANCAACCAFWAALTVPMATASWHLLAAPLFAHTLASVVERHLNQQ